MRELLGDHDLRSLLTSQWVAQAADGLVQATFANELILEPEGTAVRILGFAALTLVPYSFIAPFMGVLVDRWPRRPLLVGTNAARAGLLIVLSVLIRFFDNDIMFYAALLALLGIGRLFLTTKGAALPVLLHERHLLQGNSLSGGGGMIAALVGGVIGVGAVGALDTPNSLMVGGIVYAAAALLSGRIRHRLGHGAHDQAWSDAVAKVVSELKAGITEVWTHVHARLPLIGIFFVRTAGMVAAIAAIIVIKDQFPDAGDRFGRLSSSALALGSAGVGAFVGAVTAPWFGRRFSEAQLMLLGFAVSGAGIIALGGINSIVAILGLTFIGGLGGFIAKVAVDALLQRALPDDYRGRGFAIYDIVYNMATVLAAALVIGGEATELRSFLIAVGALTILLAAALGSAMTRVGMLNEASVG